MPRKSVRAVPLSASLELHKALVSLDSWPSSWKTDDADIAIGEVLVECFKRFLTELHFQGLALRTINRHKGNLWILGGEIIRKCNAYPSQRSTVAENLLHDTVSDDGGPLLPGYWTDADQTGFDATCRKLAEYLSKQRSNDGVAASEA
jgi:hypothetical protein